MKSAKTKQTKSQKRLRARRPAGTTGSARILLLDSSECGGPHAAAPRGPACLRGMLRQLTRSFPSPVVGSNHIAMQDTASFMQGRRKIRGDRDVKQHFHTMKTITLVTCSLVAAFSFSACSRKAPQAGPPAPEVLVVEAATRDVPVYREWVGTIDGSSNADIRARVGGHLIKRDYVEGALVKQGDLLFEIDPRPFEAALAKAKANLESARATETKTRPMDTPLRTDRRQTSDFF
jgi:hypothetical protein